MATSSTESSTSSTLLSRSEDCDSSPESPLSIRRKRAHHIDSNYQSEWSLKYHGIKRSNKGSTYAFCSLCGVDVSIAGGGVHRSRGIVQTITIEHIMCVLSFNMCDLRELGLWSLNHTPCSGKSRIEL